jgi:glutamate dehydrogenase/leucine dehydrogenase
MMLQMDLANSPMMIKHVIKRELYDIVPDEPLFIAVVDDPALDLKGWVVIHSMGYSASCGGVRLYPDVSLEEVTLLARAMTYKYCFYRLVDRGGAKAGVQMPIGLHEKERVFKLRHFGRHIQPLLRTKTYSAWTDMNSSDKDIMHIYEGAGMRRHIQRMDTAYPTAVSTFASLKASVEHLGISPGDCKIAIEGLGKVGRYLAGWIQQWGGRIVGASTCVGAAVNLEGIDIHCMLETAEQYGDEWVHQKGNWEVRACADLLSQPVDILVPCARVYSLTEAVADNLRCKAVVPAANVPCSPQAEELLLQKGTVVLPDFIVNSGGIIGPPRQSHTTAETCFINAFSMMIQRLLKLSERKQISCIDLAREVCNKEYAYRCRMVVREQAIHRKIARVMTNALIPDQMQASRRRRRILHILNTRFCERACL